MKPALLAFALLGLAAGPARAAGDPAAAEALARVRALLEREAFAQARRMAETALDRFPGHAGLAYARAQALRGLARGLQRAHGYDAALAFLERNLTHPLLVAAYGEVCVWAGREERGLATLRASGLAPAERLQTELELLSQLRRYDEVAALARAAGNAPWVEWAEARAARRARLLVRGRRGRIAAALALAVLLAAAGGLFILAPAPRPAARAGPP